MAPNTLEPSAGLQAIGYEKLHELASSNRPPGALKKANNTWIAILLHSIRQPKEIKTRNSFVWIKCHPKITLRTIENEYFMRHPLEEFRLYYDGTGDFPPPTAEVRILRYHDPLKGTYPKVKAQASAASSSDQAGQASENLAEGAGAGEDGKDTQTPAEVPAQPEKATAQEPVIIVLRAFEKADIDAVHRSNYYKRKNLLGKGTDVGNAITLGDSDDEDMEEDEDAVDGMELDEDVAAAQSNKRKIDSMENGVDGGQYAAQVNGEDGHEAMADEEHAAYTPNWDPFIDRFSVLPPEAQHRINTEQGITFCSPCGKQMYYKPWTRFSADNKPLCTECTKKDLEDLDEQVELAEVEGWIEEEFAEKHVREKGHGIPQNTDADAKIDFDAELGNSTLEGSWQAVYDQVAAAAGGAAAAAGANAAVQNGYTDEEDPQSDEDEEVQQPNAEDDASSSDETSELSDSDSSEEEEDEMMHTAAHAPEDAEPNVPEDLEAETTITSRLNHFERSSTPFPDDTSDDVEQQLPVMPVYSTTTNVAKPPTPPTSDAPIADVDEAETSSSEGTVAEDVVEDKDENKDEDAASEASFATAGGEEDNALDSPAGSAKSGSASGSGSRWSSLGKSVRGWFGKGKMGVGPGSGSGSGGSSDGDGDAADGGKLKKHVRFVEDSGLMGEDGDEVIGAAEEQGGPEYDADEDEDVEE